MTRRSLIDDGCRALRVALLVWAALPGRAAWSLDALDLPELIALDERMVAQIQAPDLGGSPDGTVLVVTGTNVAGGAAAVMAPVDGRPAVVIPNVASPRVASAPHDRRLACWQQGAPSPTGASQFVLSIFDPQLGVCVPLAGLAAFEAAPPVVWLADPDRILTLRQQREYTALVIYDPEAGKPAPLMATVAGLGTALRPGATPGSVIVGTVGLDGQPESYLIDVETGVASNGPEEETPVAPPREAREKTPGTSPTGKLVAVCRQDGLHVSAPDRQDARRLLPRGALGVHSYAAVSPPVWSPTEEHLAYTVRNAQGVAEVYVVTLGLEEIVGEIRYKADDTTPGLGATVWVCMELQRDADGRVIEPKWPTLKAQLEVTASPMDAEDGQIVRARSIGVAADTLKRLTGLDEPPAEMADQRNLRIGRAGAPPQTVLRSFTLPARHGLIAWSEGASTGEVLSVKVTRRALSLIGRD